eukprot:c16187_g1_i3.p1 GENE.c16187_g1_i3~~c16187_g1_i3.p1  ORF type:complete len:823 (+),score=198.15 c16187_g1_i3:24-2471(+)
MFKKHPKGLGLIHFVAFAEFDEDRGPTIRDKFPKEAGLGKYSDDDLAEFVLPEQAHIADSDTSYIVMQVDNEPLFGISHFEKRKDPTLKRGARQVACLVVARRPYFNVFSPFIQAALARYFDPSTKDKDILKTIHKALTDVESQQTVTVWSKEMPTSIPMLKLDEFGGVSLTKLVQLFLTNTMILWYAMLRQERILFSGQSANVVGNCALACPLLVAPINGFTANIAPYVPLRHFDDFMHKQTYIIGCTNPMFENKPDLVDVVASMSPAPCIIHAQNLKISGKDKSFIKNVINGIEDGKTDNWVRHQFQDFTSQFLNDLENNSLGESQRKYVGPQSDRPFTKTPLYGMYLKARMDLKSPGDVVTPQMILEEIKQTQNDKRKPLLLQQLHTSLDNITDIEAMCDSDCLAVLKPLLESGSNNERKYAVLILASLASIIKGQIALLSQDTLPRILAMVTNPTELPNVQNAACNCLMKISNLFIGAKALVDAGAAEPLSNVIVADAYDNMIMKTHAAATLLHMHRFVGLKPPENVEGFRHQLQASDRAYRMVIVQLLDLWGVDTSQSFEVLPQVAAILERLAVTKTVDHREVPDVSARTQATRELQELLVATPVMVMDAIEGGCLPVLWQNQQLDDPRLAQASWDVINLATDTHLGALNILKLNTIETVVNLGLEDSDEPSLYRHCRFLEIVCQRKTLGQALLACNGLQKIVRFIVKHFASPVRLLCIPMLSAIRYLLRLQHDHYEYLRKSITPLRDLTTDTVDEQGEELERMRIVVLHLARVSLSRLSEDDLLTQVFQSASRRNRNSRRSSSAQSIGG